MSQFGQDLIESLKGVVDFLEGEGPAIVHHFALPREIREKADMTQTQMATLLGMELSIYQEWEAQLQEVRGPVASLLRLIEKEPQVVKNTLLLAS